MTPLKLTFKGINSYYDEVFIDFRALTKKGLFGIFGPTGSGKTTILDAMIIALYGQKSIPRSNADFINSKSDKAFICFEFEMDDSLYTVRRSFKRSTESIITDSAVLTRNSLAVAEKAKNVDSYIIQTIGLQAKDFTKCVMLPQGQFNEFLTSKGRDRSEILEKIFDLQQYGSILQQKAASYFNELKMRRSVIESKLSLYTNISVQNIVTLKEKSNELKKKKELLSVQSEQLEQESALIRSQLQDLETLRKEEKRLKELMTQKEYVRSLKTTADKALAASQVFPVLEQCEKLSSSISQTTGEKNDHEKTLGELKIQLDKMEKEYLDSKQQYQEKLPQIIADCENIKSFIEKKTQAQKIEKECLSLKEKLSEAQTRKESLNLELSKIEETKKHLNDLLEKTEAGRKIFLVLPQQRQDNDTINQLTLKASSLAKNIEKLSGQVKEAEIRLESSAKSLDMLKQKEGLCKEQLGQKQQQLIMLENELEDIKKKNYLAFIMKDLKDGDTCPVCNGIFHPSHSDHLAAADLRISEIEYACRVTEKSILELSNTLLTIKEQISALNADTASLLAIKERLSADITETNTQKEDTEHEIILILERNSSSSAEHFIKSIKEKDQKFAELDKQMSESTRILKEEGLKESSVMKNLSEITSKISELSAKLDEKSIQLKALNEEMTARPAWSKDPYYVLSNLEIQKKQIETRYTKLEESFSQLRKNYENTNTELHSIIKTLETYSKMLSEKETLLTAQMKEKGFSDIQDIKNYYRSQNKLEQMQEQISTHEKELAISEKTVKNLSEKITDRTLTYDDLQKKNEVLSAVKKEYEALSGEIATTESKIKEMSEKLTEKTDMEKEYGLIKKEADTAELLNKKLRGNEFVKYVSSLMMENILSAASSQLRAITNNRYSLETDESAFIIRDDFNGGYRRRVDTLSGGEIFLASLCLALALSAHIQLKGKKSIRFFFIDEGFGSLDSSLIDTVMSSLEKIQQKHLCVGLISHVEEMKERIQSKLIIYKQETENGITSKIDII